MVGLVFVLCVDYAFTSGGGLDELPKDDTLAPSRPVIKPSISHSEVVSESLNREVVLGGDK